MNYQAGCVWNGGVAIAGFLLAVLLGAGKAWAADNMSFYGTLILPPPCIINNDQLIEINFGDDLLASRIDGVNYSKIIDYTLDCREASGNALRMQIQGSAATFNGALLATDEPLLGIGLKANSANLPVNTWYNLNGSAKPILSAVPVGIDFIAQPTGAFSAGATMLFEFR